MFPPRWRFKGRGNGAPWPRSICDVWFYSESRCDPISEHQRVYAAPTDRLEGNHCARLRRFVFGFGSTHAGRLSDSLLLDREAALLFFATKILAHAGAPRCVHSIEIKHAIKVYRHSSAKKKGFVLLAISILPLTGHSTSIDLGPSALYTNAQLGPIAFADLNGTPVNGSTLSFDVSFSAGKFVRLFSNTTPIFDISLSLQTNAGTFPGFVTNVSAYLIAQDGSAIPGFSVVGRADSSSGGTSLGFFPLLAENGTPNTSLSFPLDFYGVHFDFAVPNEPSVDIIGADFALIQSARFSQFAVGPHVPDAGSTLLLFLVAATGLVAAKNWRAVAQLIGKKKAASNS